MCAHTSLASILNGSNGGAARLSPFEADLESLSDAERLSLGQAVRTFQTHVGGAAPAIFKGASAGAAGGPMGMVIGGLAGGATSFASGALRTPRRQRRRRHPTGGSQTPAPPGAAGMPDVRATSAPPLGSGNAAAQLLAVMQHPQTLGALASLVTGTQGAHAIPPGQTAAPPPAFLNLIGSLVQRVAARDDAPSTPGAPDDQYLRGDDGEYAWDPANPDARADALLAHLLSSPAGGRGAAGSGSAEDWLLESGLAEMIESAN